jgi:hypothetical protein
MPPTPPPQRARRSRGVFALLASLALLILLGGIGLIYYSAVALPAQIHAQATSTAQAIQTANANATGTANAQATNTAVAYANATVTAQAQQTAQAQATTTALQAIYTQATQGTPAFNSSLSAQDGNNWDQNQTTDGGGCGFNGGAYHATILSTNFYVPCFAQASNFGNFAYQVQMTINKGDIGGLIFRADSQNAKFYRLLVDHTGSYGLLVTKDSKTSTPLADGSAPSFNTNYGQSNTLAVVARGANIYLYINKQYVGSISDSTYASGQIGVFAGDTANNTDVSFTNTQVWKL